MRYGMEFSRELSSLRRYARAITGNQEVGDDLVVATLEIAISMKTVEAHWSARAEIFRLLTSLINAPAWSARVLKCSTLRDDRGYNRGATPQFTADQRLHGLPLLSRQAFLLIAMEKFSETEAGRILDVNVNEFAKLLVAARSNVAGQIASDVLIIEDEFSVASELEDIVRQLGHNVVGIANTRDSAVEIMRNSGAELVLADIDLADGSNGIEAVSDILRQHSMSVIFMTAFPEQLLTSLQPEPAFLIKKPFCEIEIRTAVSQALFFRERASETLSN